MPHLGLASRLEREILTREPAHREPTQRSLLRLEMESSFQLSGQAGDSRRQEVTQTLAFRDSLTPLRARALGRTLPPWCANRSIPGNPAGNAFSSGYRPGRAPRRGGERGETPPEPVRDIRPIATGAAVGQLRPISWPAISPSPVRLNFDAG